MLVENEHLVDTLLNTATKEELIFLALHYMQITAENIIDWHERVEQYCEDEDGEAANASVRSSALDLILVRFQTMNDLLASSIMHSGHL